MPPPERPKRKIKVSTFLIFDKEDKYHGKAFNKEYDSGWLLLQNYGMDLSVIFDPEKKGWGNLCWAQFVADKDNDKWDTGFLTIDGNGRLGIGAEPSYWMFELDPIQTPSVMKFGDINHKAYKMEVTPEVVGDKLYAKLSMRGSKIRLFEKMKEMPESLGKRSIMNVRMYDPDAKFFLPVGCDPGQDIRELENYMTDFQKELEGTED